MNNLLRKAHLWEREGSRMKSHRCEMTEAGFMLVDLVIGREIKFEKSKNFSLVESLTAEKLCFHKCL